ncbi:MULTISPECIES: N-acetyltransferase [unclassified Arthrobacter]|uniref:GNAT family N-acetyltransferase n=1 Tax=unclassified Arthrobacter TaxID=235627 RepID=UPI000CE32CD7|nr:MULTISPECIES: GNAT family N-acetyltransferase [unclassified Arthrobacter]
MKWTITSPPSEKYNDLNKFLEDNIIGFSADNARYDTEVAGKRVASLLPRNVAGIPYQGIWRVAYDENGTLAGVINSSMPFSMAFELGTSGYAVYAKGFLKERRVISGLAVREEMRGRGVGKLLLQANEAAAKQQKASLIVGFMDDRNGSPQVYKSAGYVIVPHNQPLPNVGKFGLNEAHAAYLNGHWFYKKI